jgi:hypothetical protein
MRSLGAFDFDKNIHIYTSEMPTLKELRELALDNDIKGTNEILGQDSVDAIDCATHLADIKGNPRFKSEDGSIFIKIWESKSAQLKPKLYIALLKCDRDDKIMVVKVTADGSGFGRGGAKRTFDYHIM